jgi:hypothetical protein
MSILVTQVTYSFNKIEVRKIKYQPNIKIFVRDCDNIIEKNKL